MALVVPYKDIDFIKDKYIDPSGNFLISDDHHEEIALAFLKKYYENDNNKKSEYNIYKFMMENYDYFNICCMQVDDFMVQVLGYEKVFCRSIILPDETGRIITSSFEPHIRLWNYYLMEHSVGQVPKVLWKDDALSYVGPYQTDADIEAENELELIKKEVKLKERHLFFK